MKRTEHFFLIRKPFKLNEFFYVYAYGLIIKQSWSEISEIVVAASKRLTDLSLFTTWSGTTRRGQGSVRKRVQNKNATDNGKVSLLSLLVKRPMFTSKFNVQERRRPKGNSGNFPLEYVAGPKVGYIVRFEATLGEQEKMRWLSNGETTSLWDWAKLEAQAILCDWLG